MQTDCMTFTPAAVSGGRLVIAVDVSDATAAFALADSLAGLPVWLKVGLELFTVAGPALVSTLLERHFALFLDLKFHDIPNTVSGAVRSACSLGVHMLSLHLCGGETMCRAAVAGREEGARLCRSRPALSFAGAENPWPPLLMGITVLTSESGSDRDVQALVVERALLAKRCGLDGVVCSGHETAAVKKACGKDFLCLCPGIRFAGMAGHDDQARVCTPSEAMAEGADFLVMGRPVIKADNPAQAAQRVLEHLHR